MPPEVRAQVVAAAEPSPSGRTMPTSRATSRRSPRHGRAAASCKLSYRSAGKQRPKEVIVEPYFLEPSAAGFATYLIGYSRTHQQMRTFKIERIVSAEMLPQSFEMPRATSTSTRCSGRHGASSGAKGIAVKLRFTPDVAWRVKESRWHPVAAARGAGRRRLPADDQRREHDGDGPLGARVGRPRRGARSRPSLRDELREEAIALARTVLGPAEEVTASATRNNARSAHRLERASAPLARGSGSRALIARRVATGPRTQRDRRS